MPKYISVRPDYIYVKPEFIKFEIDEVSKDSEDEFYTLEELYQMEDKSMEYIPARFKYIKFRKNPWYQNGTYRTKFQGKESYLDSGSGSRSSVSKPNMFDKSKVRCYNSNNREHFAIECRKPKVALVNEKSNSYDKNSYEDLKK